MDKHQGWTNEATWAVNLWLSREAEDAIGIIIDDAPPDDGEERVEYVADALKITMECDGPEPPDDMLFSCLIRYAMEQVNWSEIARHWLEAVKP